MIEIRDLNKKYKDFELNISLSIPKGRISGLIGKNGAGKSTTIKAILGLIRKDSGTVEVFGKDPRTLTPAEKQRIGVALAESGFSGYLNVRIVCTILKNMYSRFDEALFLKRCDELRLPLDKQIREFSTGMKAKLRVLTALSVNADLLILDEPTAGLDVEARNEILDMLRMYMEQQPETSVLISSHISSDLENLCDDLYLIDNGKLLLHEDTDVVLDKYGVLKCDEETFKTLDQHYLLRTVKEKYGYRCLTNEKQFYQENCPGVVVERAGIDDLILMLTGGKKQ
ncbi:MAG: ABC transporter ATP-binding protein [Erysipelotrichaceae bacterium]|nr:ABC transporter ATP-binding protein [Erysipelotrichaceae bacterium]